MKLLSSRLPMIFQVEAAECGLACIAMIAGYYRHRIDLSALRNRFSVSLQGVNLAQIVYHADAMNLTSRPLRLELDEMHALKMPCILHWDLNHFVVLKKVSRKGIVIHDPALGIRRLAFAEASKHFTGIALEMTPGSDFKPADDSRRVSLRGVMGRIDGLWSAFFLVVFMALALEGFGLVGPLLNQWVVDEVLVANDVSLLNVLVIGFALVLVIQTAIAQARGWTMVYLSTQVGLQWGASVFTHLLKLPVAWFEKRHLGDVMSRFGSLGAIQQTLTYSFVSAILDGLMAIATLAMMLVYSVKLAAVVMAAIGLYLLMRWFSYRPLREASEEHMVLNAHAETCFMETVRGIEAVKLFGRELERRNRWLNLWVAATNRGVRTEKFHLWFNLGKSSVFGIQNLLVIWLSARMIIDGDFTIGRMFAFGLYQMQFVARFTALIDKLMEYRMLSLHAERLADIVLEPAEMDMPDEVDAARLQPGVELVGVSFRYAEGAPWVVHNLNLSIEPGESVALVGPSGCGKTTLVKLMLGLLTPTEGEIRYGGVPIRQLGHRAYRDLIAVVMQDDHLLSGSISDNIHFFDPHPDDERVRASAELAAIHEDIAAMPMGYHTPIGDMGTALSGGQKQRILLARALYRNPKVLVLDEATSHLDVDRERRVAQAISALQVTRISVAHRPETIAMSDRIIRLNRGVIEHDSRHGAIHFVSQDEGGSLPVSA